MPGTSVNKKNVLIQLYKQLPWDEILLTSDESQL